jgi:hypothetical protein
MHRDSPSDNNYKAVIRAKVTPLGSSHMRGQLLLMLLLPPPLLAQSKPEALLVSNPSFFLADNASLFPAPSTVSAPASNLPDTPQPQIGRLKNVSEAADVLPNAGALPALVYEPQRQSGSPPVGAKTAVSNKMFITTHAVYFASTVYDGELTHEGLAHHRCEESNPNFGTHPSRDEFYSKNMLVFGAVTGVDWLTAKTGVRYLPYVGPAVATAVHVTGGSKWLTNCW